MSIVVGMLPRQANCRALTLLGETISTRLHQKCPLPRARERRELTPCNSNDHTTLTAAWHLRRSWHATRRCGPRRSEPALSEQHGNVQSGQRQRHCRPGGFHCLSFRLWSKYADRDRIPWQFSDSKCTYWNPGTDYPACATNKDRLGPVTSIRRTVHTRHPGIHQNGTTIGSPWASQMRRHRLSGRRAGGPISRSKMAYKEGGFFATDSNQCDTRRWTKQQLTHRDGEPDDGQGSPVSSRDLPTR